MKKWTTENMLVAMFLTAVFIAGLFFGHVNEALSIREAQAQVGQTIEERQVIALEKMASEMGRMRRDGIKLGR